MRTKIFEARGAIAILLLLPFFLSLPCFFGYAWAEGDLVRQFYPWKELGRQALAAGRLPLWNPYVYCGMPLLGNFQSALAYPPHFIFYFMNFVPALGLHLFFHFFVSGLGFYALSRALGMSQKSALLAALSWQCNAFLLARVEFMSALSAYAWTPWILWAVVARRGAAVSATLIGLQVLAGYPLELGYTLVASLAFAFFVGDGVWKKLALGWVLGLALGGLQLLPGLELLKHSSRLAGDIPSKTYTTLHLTQMARWLWPFERQFWAVTFSVSIPALLLAPFARGKAAWPALLFVAVGLGLSFGLGASLAPNRHPSLALVYCSMGIALLAGFGAERLPHKFYALSLALILAEALIPWMRRGNLVKSDLYRPADSGGYLASHVEPGMRFMLSPEVQNELESAGKTTTEAWSRFGIWMQANSSAPQGLHDANGYDPLAPAQIVSLLKNASNDFGKNAELMNLLGVEALVDWDKKNGRFSSAITRRQARPLRGFVGQDFSFAGKRWQAEFLEDDPETVRLRLPVGHPQGWAFLNDTYYPGWKAFVDGKEVEISQALGAFRAVPVDENSREVVMSYRPESSRIGFLLSLAAFLGIILLNRRGRQGVI